MIPTKYLIAALIAGAGFGTAGTSLAQGSFDGFSFGLTLLAIGAGLANVTTTRSARLYANPMDLRLSAGMWIAHTAAIFIGVSFALVYGVVNIFRTFDNVLVCVLATFAALAFFVFQLVSIGNGWSAHRRHKIEVNQAARRVTRKATAATQG